MNTETTQTVEWRAGNSEHPEFIAHHNGLRLRLHQYQADSYSCAGKWLWIVAISDTYLSDIVPTKEEAQATAEAWANKGRDAVLSEIVREKQAEIDKIVREIAKISPAAVIPMTGYATGYDDGFAAATKAVADALGLVPRSELEQSQRETYDAQRSADLWNDMALELQDQLHQLSGGNLSAGITKDGETRIVETAPSQTEAAQ